MAAKNDRAFSWSAENQLLSVGDTGAPGGSTVRLNVGGADETVGSVTWAACTEDTTCNGWATGGYGDFVYPALTITGATYSRTARTVLLRSDWRWPAPLMLDAPCG